MHRPLASSSHNTTSVIGAPASSLDRLMVLIINDRAENQNTRKINPTNPKIIIFFCFIQYLKNTAGGCPELFKIYFYPMC
jgi:hypothetical protein